MSISTVNHYPSRQQQHLTTNSTKNSNYDLNQLTQDNEVKKPRKKSHSKDRKPSSSSSLAKYEYTEVFVWGDDSSGQLGLYHQKVKKGTLNQTSFKVPKSCSFNILIKQVSCGDNHSAILTNQGHLYMMGNNQEGQLGIGDNCPDFQNKECAGAPCLVDSLRDVKVEQVQCGSNFTIAMGINNNFNSSIIGQENLNKVLYGWGFNENGQIGLPFAEKIDIPMRICAFDDCDFEIVSFSCGKEHTLFTNSLGQVYATGSNNFGQLCITSEEKSFFSPTIIEDLLQYQITQASAGYQHSLFLTQDGVVFGCGSNQTFQLGVTDQVQYTDRPVKIQGLQNYKINKIEAKSHSAAITQNGELFLWGKGIFGQYRVPQKILTISNKVTDVSLGQSLGAAVDEKGLLWTWGANQSGELGVGDNDPRVHPYPVLTLKGKTVTQIHCGGQFVIALGQNIKKDIPGLKLKKAKESVLQRQKSESTKQTQQTQQSERKSDKKVHRSLSKSKKNNSSSSKLLRKNSIQSSLTKIYGNQSDYQNSNIQSPKSQNSKKGIKVPQQRHSKSSINKSKLSDIPKSTKSKIRVRQSMIGSESQPFSGEDTSMISHSLNTTYHNNPHKRKTLSNLLSNISSSSPQTHKPSQDQQSNHYEQIQMINNNSSNNNKERIIRDLQNENKQIKNEADILKKELRQARQQIEQHDKQMDKQKIQQQQNQELQTALMKLRLKKQKVKDLKKQLGESMRLQEEIQRKYEVTKEQKDSLQVQKDQFINQVELVQQEYSSLHSKYSLQQQKLSLQDSEIQEFQLGLQQISLHSKDVEQNLLAKLHETSDKYQQSITKIEYYESQYNDYVQLREDMKREIKEQQAHIRSVESENVYLREEIEKAKYSKDKDQYSKFVSGLVQLKNKPVQLQQRVNNENQENQQQEKVNQTQQQIKSPFKETTNNTFAQQRKSLDNSHKKDQENIPVVVQKQAQPEVDYQELKMSYNQKLLKSLEKKTTVNRINRQ